MAGPALGRTSAYLHYEEQYLSRTIAESEYHVTWQEAPRRIGVDSAWQAPNRARRGNASP